MAWIAILGIAAVVAAALALALSRAAWWWCAAGAAGWLLAQGAKYVLLLPLLLTAGPAGVAHAASLPWFALAAALLAGTTEELGKYLPLRWLRVATREQAIALGLGAGALEALVLLGSAAAVLGGAATLAAALIPVWERVWAVATHAGLAMVDGVAVVRRRARWLLAAMGMHAAVDLGAGWYAHLVTAGAPATERARALVGAEIWTAVAAVAIWYVALRLWRPAAAAG